MTFARRIAGAMAFGATILTGAGLSASPAQAAFTVTLLEQEQIQAVFATGSGSLDLTDLSNSTATGCSLVQRL